MRIRTNGEVLLRGMGLREAVRMLDWLRWLCPEADLRIEEEGR